MLDSNPLPEVDTATHTTRRAPTDRHGLIIALVGLAGVLAWISPSAYRQSLFMVAATYALIALGMYVPFVLSGSLSMAYTAYAAVGGYAVAIIASDHGLPIWVGWFVGAPISAFVAVILGWVTRRLSGFYLVAVTLLFANAFMAWVRSSHDLTGAEAGIGGLPQLDLFGWQPTSFQRAVMGGLTVCLVAYLVDRIRLSRWGVTLRAMREVPHAVEAVGVRVPTMQLVALGMGAMIGSFAGSLFVASAGSVTPGTFSLMIVFMAVFMPIIGGMGTPWGAVLGALIVAQLTLNMGSIAESGTLVVALGVLVILLVAPKGVLGTVDGIRHWLLERITKRRDGAGDADPSTDVDRARDRSRTAGGSEER